MNPPEHVAVKRSDPVYMAHAYLTKVPVAAIVPFIEAFTKPGEVVMDPFAGSGMTGVAAAMTRRRARLFDVSVLGRHIGTNYVRLVDPLAYRSAAGRTVGRVRGRLPGLYSHPCSRCGRTAELSRRVISVLVSCPSCQMSVPYFDALKDAGWKKLEARCSRCGGAVQARTRQGERAVLDTISCPCSPTLFEQAPTEPLAGHLDTDGLNWPTTPIDPDRQMFQASALGKHNLLSVDRFFSVRNLTALAALRSAISDEDDPE
ncbi:MAG: DNA methyltransferase, partial [Acidimicrobiales bacterium]